MNACDKLKTKLAELFQLDQADLDFGIYRIMNARRDEITKFLERDLLPQVKTAFSEYKSSDKTEIQKELDKVTEAVQAAGMNPNDSPKVKELKSQLAESAVDVSAMETDVYDHLHRFFARYYDEGDFISMRRYKEGVYAIPYEGEEIKLHWANADQYYVKTSENFRDYTFKTLDDCRVHFKIVEADTEKDNIKAADDKQRRFMLYHPQITQIAADFEDKYLINEDELALPFIYQPDTHKRSQDAINKQSVDIILKLLLNNNLRESAKSADKICTAWHKRLSAFWTRSDGTKSEKNLLEKHLNDYTKKNTFDYFIHKDLGKFLRRELDFYIKNEVMYLDDIEHANAAKVEQYLSKIKVIRKIAHKIIEFLSQLENFQKKLWLKKKFVLETNYCITLDRVPEELYPAIAANNAQRSEWVKLFAIDEIKADSGNLIEGGSPAYTDPLTVEFLKANNKLVLDTKFFDDQFKAKLLASLENFDEQCDGLLIHSENFQALNLLQERFREQVKCIYIDPPYNTSASEIIYKNSYKHSSWLSFLNDRIQWSKMLMADSGVMCATIDDFEFTGLSSLLSDIFSEDAIAGVAAIKNNPSGRATPKGFSIAHEYAIFAMKSTDTSIGRLSHSEEQAARYKEEDSKGKFEWVNFRKHGGANANHYARPKLYYPIFASSHSIRIPEVKWEPRKSAWCLLEQPNGDEQIIYPIDSSGNEKTWKWGIDTAKENLAELRPGIDQDKKLAIYRKARLNSEGTLPRTIWDKTKYSATAYGTNYLAEIFGEKERFSFPKSIYAVEDCLRVSNAVPQSIIIDYFAGSGTSGHAVINLNREDGGNRKYILVEMGEHFENVLKPRISKVIYSSDWKNGKPVACDTGISHCFKYIKLESYEDSLSNIQLKRKKYQQMAFDQSDSFRESYMLGYMLEEESKNSPSLLNVSAFDDPFSYQLMVGTGSAGETQPVHVDLVETFNYLIGLKIKTIQTYNPRITQMGADKIITKNNQRESAKSADKYVVIEGENLAGKKILVIWRKVCDLNMSDDEKIAARRQSNEELDAFFKKQQYNTLDMEFDLIYVNGDNNLMNIPVTPEGEGTQPRYKVRLIEEEFKKLMFDVEGM